MVALSTTELEYIGLSNAGQHLAWLWTFFDEIGHPQKGPTQLFCDNQAAIILSRNPQFQAWTKHIQQKYHFVRDDLVGKGEAIVCYVPTGDMVADILMKPLVRDLHWKFVKAMELRLHSSGSDSIQLWITQWFWWFWLSRSLLNSEGPEVFQQWPEPLPESSRTLPNSEPPEAL